MLEYFEKLSTEIVFKNGKPYWVAKPKHSRWPIDVPAGTVRKDGRRRIRCSIKGVGKLILAHHLSWFIAKGFLPLMLDHKNRVPDDNDILNLREATTSENAQNRKVSGSSITGITGVNYDPVRNQYRAAIAIQGARYRKRFKTLEEALAWRKEQEVLLHPFRPC